MLRLAAAHLAEPADLFDVGETNLADLLNIETGQVEPALVDTAVLGLLSSRPGLGRGMVPSPRVGFGQDTLPAVSKDGKSWAGLIRKGK